MEPNGTSVRPIDVANFENIGGTAFGQWALAEMRAFARGLSDSGLAADARAIAKSGENLADSIAELERDTNASAPRWKGEPSVSAQTTMSTYRTRSFDEGVAVGDLSNRVDAVAESARDTKNKYSDITELQKGAALAGIPESVLDSAAIRATAGAGISRSYTQPIQGSASTLPLNTIRTEPVVGGSADGMLRGTSGPGSTGAPSTAGGPTAGTGGPSGSDPSGPGSGPTDDDPDGTKVDGAAARSGALSDQTGSTAGTGGTQTMPASAAQALPVSAPQSDTARDGRNNDYGDSGVDPDQSPLQDDSPYLGESPVSPLLAPASAVNAGSGSLGSGPSARTGGLTGGRIPDSGRAASPLGLRQDAGLKSTAGAGTVGAAGQGARASSSPYGVPPAGAGAGQKGQGDTRRRVPGYLIDRKNGEELVGELPMVGPSVIGQWRDPAADAPPGRGPKPPRTD